MSTSPTREAISAELVFTDDTQKSDLLDESLTSTELIEFLQQLLSIRDGVWKGKKLEVLSVRTDHPTEDGPDGHQGGNAIDFAPILDDADVHLMQDLNNCPRAMGVGLGGFYQKYLGLLTHGFTDNSEPHIHVQVLNY